MIQYENGNTTVTLDATGTKTRTYSGVPAPVFPESIDVKITNYCDMGCEYCHEKSTTAGQHGNLQVLEEVLSKLPAGVEIAIGGGNPLSHPGLKDFLQHMKYQGIICNLTVNQGHLKTFNSLIRELLAEDLTKG